MERPNDPASTDLDLAIDGILYALDFKLWYGKSTFNNALAEVIRREYSGRPPCNLLDVLESVASSYAGDVADAFNGEGSNSSHNEFYRYIDHIRCESDGVQWEQFFQRLLRTISGSCERLQGNNPSEQRNTQRTRSRQNYEETGRSNSQEGTRPSSAYSSASQSPTGSRASSRPSRGASREYVRSTTSSSRNDKSKYTMAVKEHFDLEDVEPDYYFQQLSLIPSMWRCTLDVDGYSVEGRGGKKQDAKHAASQKLCSLVGIV